MEVLEDLELARLRVDMFARETGGTKPWDWEEQGSLWSPKVSYYWEDLGREVESPLWRASNAACGVGFGHPMSKGGASEVSEWGSAVMIVLGRRS